MPRPGIEPQGAAQGLGTMMREELDLIANEKSHQVRRPETLHDFGRAIARGGCLVECAVKFIATYLDSGRLVLNQETVEPMQRTIERAAEVEKQGRNHLREPPSLPVQQRSH